MSHFSWFQFIDGGFQISVTWSFVLGAMLLVPAVLAYRWAMTFWRKLQPKSA